MFSTKIGPWADHRAAQSRVSAASLVAADGAAVPLSISDSAAPNVAVINETALHRFFPNGAIGRRIHIGPTATGPAITIVGVVADMHGEGASYPVLPTLFPYHGQQARESSLSIAIRTRSEKAGFGEI